MAFYEEVLSFLVNIGLIDVILPFLLIYAITYGTLQRTKALGGKKNLDSMVAFCCGFLAIAATQLLNIVNILLGWLVMALVVVIMLALILGLAGAKVEGNKYLIGLAVAIFAIMTLGGLFAAGAITQEQLQSAVLLPLILGGALIGVIIYTLSPEPKEDEEKKKKKTAPPAPEEPEEEEPDQEAVDKAFQTLKKAGIQFRGP